MVSFDVLFARGSALVRRTACGQKRRPFAQTDGRSDGGRGGHGSLSLLNGFNGSGGEDEVYCPSQVQQCRRGDTATARAGQMLVLAEGEKWYDL